MIAILETDDPVRLSYLKMTGIDLSAHKVIGPWLARCTERPACARAD